MHPPKKKEKRSKEQALQKEDIKKKVQDLMYDMLIISESEIKKRGRGKNCKGLERLSIIYIYISVCVCVCERKSKEDMRERREYV